jgi:hypothetical protein
VRVVGRPAAGLAHEVLVGVGRARFAARRDVRVGRLAPLIIAHVLVESAPHRRVLLHEHPQVPSADDEPSAQAEMDRVETQAHIQAGGRAEATHFPNIAL